MTEKCTNCKKEATNKVFNGLYFCEEHAIRFYEAGDVNRKLTDNVEVMTAKGIKRGSFKWTQGNLQIAANIMGKQRVRVDWKKELEDNGLWGVIKVFIIFYFFVK